MPWSKMFKPNGHFFKMAKQILAEFIKISGY